MHRKISIQSLAENFVNDKSDSTLRPLIKRLKPGLLSYVYKYVNDNDMSQQLVSQTFINVWEKLHQYNSKWNFSTWIYSIARNVALGHLRKEKKNVSREKLTENNSKLLKIYSPQVTMDLEVIGLKGEQLVDFLHDESIKEIGNLSGDYKTVMVERVINEKKIKDIAIHLDWKESTVKTRLRKARTDIADVLKEKYSEYVEAWYEI